MSRMGGRDRVDRADDISALSLDIARRASVSPGQAQSTERDDDANSNTSSSSEEDAQREHLQPARREEDEHPKSWIPYTFQHRYLFSLSLITLILCLLCFLFFWWSETHYGLGKDDGSSALVFGWRFSPTLITVIYIQLIAMLFEDAKRTEPFARLARPAGSSAAASILQSPAPWWIALRDSFSRKKNGSRKPNWVFLCATIVNILGFLAISPLSSAFFVSEDVSVPRKVSFRRLSPRVDSKMPLDIDRTTYFRTIGNLLRNVSTSPWITDTYTALPFWPAYWQDEPLTSLSSEASQTWTADTMVFRSELDCTSMSVADIGAKNTTYGNFTDVPSISANWTSNDGCQFGLAVPMVHDMVRYGGGSWSNTSGLLFMGKQSFTDGQVNSELSYVSSSLARGCEQKEVIILSEPLTTADGQPKALLCSTTYTMANVNATMTLSAEGSHLSFDEGEYNRKKTEVPAKLINSTHLQDLILSPDWSRYMTSLIWTDSPDMGGPSVLLGALYTFNMSNLLTDPDLLSRISRVKQRIFGEVLQSALAQPEVASKQEILGETETVERRVVVVAGPAIAMGVLFFVSLCLLLAIWWLSRLRNRPLRLDSDPATAASVAHLIADNDRTRMFFRELDQSSRKVMEIALKDRRYRIDEEGISEVYSGLPNNPCFNQDGQNYQLASVTKWTPIILRRPTLLAMIVCLIVTIVGISVLYHFAETSELYQQAFIYQASITIFNKNLPTIAPFSMIPTLIAVIIGLWWTAIDDAFRRLQPFLAMSRGSPQLSKGVYLSYQSSYWIWAAAKAAFNQHWLLFLITSGTALSPIFTTSMSALFERSPGDITEFVTLSRQLEVRQIPLVFETMENAGAQFLNDYASQVIQNLYRNLSSHWMYSAPIQLALNGSQPAWSQEGWNFVPVDLSSISTSSPLLASNALDQENVPVAPAVNVSLQTPALRGRIECSPFSDLLNLSSWLSIDDLSNRTIWDSSTTPKDVKIGYELGALRRTPGIPNMMYSASAIQNRSTCLGCTSVFANPSQIICCGNSSDPVGSNVAVGYWSPNAGDSWSARSWQHNFTTKWISGRAKGGVHRISRYGEDREDHLVFMSVPSITAMNCNPIVESANAEVLVNPITGEIQSYKILDEPQMESSAFSDVFLPHAGGFVNRSTGLMVYNATVSYGPLFLTSMLTAADTIRMYGSTRVGGFMSAENVYDNTFNFRDETAGLNLDLMTYAMFSMARQDPSALLDIDTFQSMAQKTFSTFFQHFVSNNVSMITGGWAYQSINASLPPDLGLAMEDAYSASGASRARLSDYQDVRQPVSHTNRTVVAKVSRRVELLQMNTVALGLSIGILAWLMIVTIVIAVLQRQYLGSLIRNIECLGDVLVLVAGSDKLVRVVREINRGALKQDELDNLHARLGWFVDTQGRLRWGIEVEEDIMNVPRTKWVSAPRDAQKQESIVREQAILIDRDD
ncbi:DUF3433 domain-containing protein [Aspergillus clavatus NRRL 1]|uniref:Uncharacterized protein n=1 Tax=Aspergillus clavatus (strain ATCC 1007 / CBS 513.65 / DSM 816 / NCTC 3887 / NRRL 1 / QM 1276 / 107) TaxID=344612 RepID=A1C5R1_ASPCL|nr:uncharacterized protein ACLA_004430 [Aspergillus clavatus NRRL 1]EAW15029.1 hypothetical protein ACLA_004430 [Aspergillus clavatus NRRL 1]